MPRTLLIQSRTALFLLGWPIASAIGQFCGSTEGYEKKFSKSGEKVLTNGSRYGILYSPEGVRARGHGCRSRWKEPRAERPARGRTRGVGVAHQGPKAKAGSPGTETTTLRVGRACRSRDSPEQVGPTRACKTSPMKRPQAEVLLCGIRGEEPRGRVTGSNVRATTGERLGPRGR